IVTFLYLRPEPEAKGPTSYEIPTPKIADFSRITGEVPAKAPVALEQMDGYWHIIKPYKVRADQVAVQRILAIVGATSADKFPADDLSRFGLDNPKLKLKLDNEEFLFGTINPVNGQQYVT